jgi:hypothetical protein
VLDLRNGCEVGGAAAAASARLCAESDHHTVTVCSSQSYGAGGSNRVVVRCYFSLTQAMEVRKSVLSA